MSAVSSFDEDLARGQEGERLAQIYFECAGWKVRRIPVARQRKGAGDLRLECPRTALICELEVKGCFGNGPNCLLELATQGSRVRSSGVLGLKADHVLVVRMRDRKGFLFRAQELEELCGEWISVYSTFPVRDEGSGTARMCVVVPWEQMEVRGRAIWLDGGPLFGPRGLG